MEEDAGPGILISKFSVDPKEFDQLLKRYSTDNEKFKQQPGSISTQLHKGIGGNGTYSFINDLYYAIILALTGCEFWRKMQQNEFTL